MADLTSNDPGDKSEKTILPYEQEASAPPHGTQAIASISIEQRKDESLKSLELPQGSSSNIGDNFENLNERQPNDSIDDARLILDTDVKQDGETGDLAKSLVEDSDPLIEKSHTVGMESEVTEKEDGHEHNDETESLRKPSPETNEMLLQAAIDGDVEEVRRILREGAEIETRNTLGETALHLACRFNHKDIVLLLLKEGANIEARDNDEWTPLISALALAYYYPNAEVISKLLEEKADVNAQDNDGDTPLIIAARYGDADMVSSILDFHPDISKVRDGQRTALHEVMLNDRRDEIVTLLVEAPGVDINSKDSGKQTPLYIASEGGYLNAVDILLAQTGVEVNASNEDDKTPLHIACERGHLEIVNKLLGKNGVNVEAKDNNKQTPLHLACLNGKVDVIRKLLEREVNNKNVPGGKYPGVWSPFVQFLIKHRNNTDSKMTQSAPSDEEKQYIGSLADTKELTLAMKWADTEDDFDLLIESIRLFESEGTIKRLKLLRMAEKGEEKSIVALFEKEFPKRALPRKSALQWAASGGYHEVVWWLLQNSLPTKETEKNIEDAKKIAKEGKDSEEKNGKNSKPQQQEKGLPEVGGKELENKSKSKRIRNEAQAPVGSYQITLDLLEDPPPFVVTLADLNDEDLTKKNLRGKLQEELKNHKASIVDFYQRAGNFDLLRRRRDVYNVIYSTDKGHGPKDVMESARETLKNIGPQNAREKAYRAEDFKMRWIHLPANNIEWMEDLTKRICKDKEMETSDWSSLNNLLQKSWQELPTSKVETRLMKPICLKGLKKRRNKNREDSSLSTPEARGNTDVKGDKEDSEQVIQRKAEGKLDSEKIPKDDTFERVALYMPYIAFGSCHQKPTEAKMCIDPPASRKSYNDLMEVYKDKVIHGTRSLDQFYYHSLVDMPLRDRSQVVTRSFLKIKNGDSVDKSEVTWPYLVVDQLWLWIIDEETIITSSTHRPDGFDDPVIGKMFRLLREAKQKKNGESPPSSVEELSRFLVTFCVDFINSLRWDEDAPPLIGIREEEAASKSIQLLYMEAINNVAAQEKELFQRFKRKMEHKGWESKQNNKKSKKDQEVANMIQSEEQNHIQQTEKDQEVDNITRSEEQNHIQETQNWSSISEAANLLDEIKDILDELMILKTLLTQQQHVWKELVGPEPERDSARGPTYTLHEIEEMIKMAERVQKSVHDILNLEQNGINIMEAVFSRQRAEDSSRQGKVLMAFTIVTVVFTPLSFLTSLFSLNITVFEHNSDGDTEYGPGWIFPIIFAVSAGVILPLMIYAAVGLGDLKNAFTKVQNRLVNISNESGKNLIKDESPSSKAEEGDMAPGNHPTNHEASQFLIWRHRPRWMNRRSGKL